MKRLLLFGMIFGLCGVGAETLIAQQAASQPRVRSTQPIRLSRCRIQLRDRATLASERAGILETVDLEEGDEVREGQEVARLKDDVVRAAVERAEKEASNDVEIRYAIKAAEVARAEYAMALAAIADVPKAVTDIEVQRLKLAAERSLLQIEQAQHRFAVSLLTAKEARAQLDSHGVKAPFDGIITRIYKQKGEAVRQGDPILEMVSTNRVRVEGYVNVSDANNVRQGSFVQVQLDIPSVELDIERETFEGRIVFVDVTTQPVTGQIRVWAEVANRDNILRAGLTATMIIDPTRKLPAKTASKNRDSSSQK